MKKVNFYFSLYLMISYILSFNSILYLYMSPIHIHNPNEDSPVFLFSFYLPLYLFTSLLLYYWYYDYYYYYYYLVAHLTGNFFLRDVLSLSSLSLLSLIIIPPPRKEEVNSLSLHLSPLSLLCLSEGGYSTGIRNINRIENRIE